MRFLMLPLYFIAAWASWQIGTKVFSRRVGLWSAVAAGAFPSYHFNVLEFRTDNLWAPLWLLCLTCLVSGVISVPRAAVAGLLLGLCFGVSMKSMLFLISLGLSAPLAIVLTGRKKLGLSVTHLA
jgi:Dolichyl-phosphate-mannose-protein mannosyltransferase